MIIKKVYSDNKLARKSRDEVWVCFENFSIDNKVITVATKNND